MIVDGVDQTRVCRVDSNPPPSSLRVTEAFARADTQLSPTRDLGREVDRVGTDNFARVPGGLMERSHGQNAETVLAPGKLAAATSR